LLTVHDRYKYTHIEWHNVHTEVREDWSIGSEIVRHTHRQDDDDDDNNISLLFFILSKEVDNLLAWNLGFHKRREIS
jgi:hypothetical protein